MAGADTVSLDEILLAFSRCSGFPAEVLIGDVKKLILYDRLGSIGGKKNLYSFQQSIQGTMKRSAPNRRYHHPPYYFYGVKRSVYRLSEDGYARLNYLNAEEGKERRRREEQARKDEQIEQRSFLQSRTEFPNPPEVVEFNGCRIVRDQPAANMLKEIYGYSCQVCGITVATPESSDRQGCGYAEVHHIKPLGAGHKGPDYPANMLVVCPNDHATLDLGSMALNPESHDVYYLEPDGGVYQKRLSNLKPDHELDPDCVMYAWESWLRKLDENGLDISEADGD